MANRILKVPIFTNHIMLKCALRRFNLAVLEFRLAVQSHCLRLHIIVMNNRSIPNLRTLSRHSRTPPSLASPSRILDSCPTVDVSELQVNQKENSRTLNPWCTHPSSFMWYKLMEPPENASLLWDVSSATATKDFTEAEQHEPVCRSEDGT